MSESATPRRLPIAVNSTVLIGAIVLAGSTLQEEADPLTIRHVAACGPFGPVADKYVDRNKICRRARKEALRSIRTGRDPDWGDVFRDSIPKASKHPRQGPASKRPRHRTEKHQPNHTPSPPSRTETRTTERVSPSSRADVERPNGPQPSVPTETAKTPVNTAPPTSPTSPEDDVRGLAGWAGAFAFLALIGGASYVGRRRRTVIQAATSMFERIKRDTRPKATPTATTSFQGTPPGVAPRIAHFATKGISLAGPGAEDAVRHLAVDILLNRQNNATELVLSRPDAWRLFGTDMGTLQDDRIPGLTLTDDPAQTRTYLARQGPSRCLLVTYDDEVEDLRALPAHQQGQPTVVSLSAWTEASVTVSTGGEVTASAAGPQMSERLPLLSRPDAFAQLMSMPTLARSSAN